MALSNIGPTIWSKIKRTLKKHYLTILTGKNCVLLNSVQGYLAASDFFDMFTQSIKGTLMQN